MAGNKINDLKIKLTTRDEIKYIKIKENKQVAGDTQECREVKIHVT